MNIINQPNINIEEDDLTFSELLFRVKKAFLFIKGRINFILIGGVLFSIIGFMIAKYDSPKYTAKLTFAMEEEKGSGGGLSGALGLASSFGIDLGSSGGGSAFAGNNLTELMKSKRIVENTLLNPIKINQKEISIADYYLQLQNYNKKESIDTLLFKPNSNRTNFTIEQNIALENIYSEVTSPKNLLIQPIDKKVSITVIEVFNENEQFAKIFCENLAKEISTYYSEIKSKKAKTNVDILQKQTDSIRIELNNAIFGVASASDNVYNLNPALNIKRTPSTKKQVDVQALTAMLTQLVAQLELAKVNLRRETPLIQIIDYPYFPLPKVQLSIIKSVSFGFLLGIFATTLIIFLIHFYQKFILNK